LRTLTRSSHTPCQAFAPSSPRATPNAARRLHACCPIAFIGKSLIDKGGQNPIEAASLGCAVLAGPSRYNFKDEYAALSAADGVITVTDATSLAAAVVSLATDPSKLEQLSGNAATAIAGLKGALPRTLDAILPLLPPPAAPVMSTGPAGPTQTDLRLQRAS
jgi:hypothetical protein